MSKKKQPLPKFSPCISETCEMMDNAIRDYNWSVEQIHRMDQLTQDYLHKLELEDLNYAERAKLATKLQQCRQMRRVYKDTVEVLDPLVKWLNSDRGKSLYNLLREVLGKTRRAEECMEKRAYYPRVLQQDAIKSQM